MGPVSILTDQFNFIKIANKNNRDVIYDKVP